MPSRLRLLPRRFSQASTSPTWSRVPVKARSPPVFRERDEAGAKGGAPMRVLMLCAGDLLVGDVVAFPAQHVAQVLVGGLDAGRRPAGRPRLSAADLEVKPCPVHRRRRVLGGNPLGRGRTVAFEASPEGAALRQHVAE